MSRRRWPPCARRCELTYTPWYDMGLGDMLISRATERNWTRLMTSGGDRLKSRANKKRSDRRIVPLEYLSDRRHASLLNNIADWAEHGRMRTEEVVFGMAVRLLARRGMSDAAHVQNVLSWYQDEFHVAQGAASWDRLLPEGEFDFLGAVYQTLLSEGEKNVRGSYYTPPFIAGEMVRGLDFSRGQKFYDPCCGSGVFLLSLKDASPEQICGSDVDPVAVFIAKVNMLLQFAHEPFEPRIECCDYLEDGLFATFPSLRTEAVDYICSNPPWGSFADSSGIAGQKGAGKRASAFFRAAYRQLKEEGLLRFLLPEALLKVKAHQAFRQFLLQEGRLEAMTLYEPCFNGVQTGCVEIAFSKKSPLSFTRVSHAGNSLRRLSLDAFRKTPNNVFSFLSDEDEDVVDQIKAHGCFNLRKSQWALGIVTEDNKHQLHDTPFPGMEAVYTGKEVGRYTLKAPAKYILYDRDSLQQVAPDKMYRAKEKLIYRFISKQLVFAYDASQALVLNSANVLIPAVPHMAIRTVLAYLNSDVMRYFYSQLFGDIKILKGNLMELPFPLISESLDSEISSLVSRVMAGEESCDAIIQQRIGESYHLNDHQIFRIRTYLYASTEENN